MFINHAFNIKGNQQQFLLLSQQFYNESMVGQFLKHDLSKIIKIR